MKLSTVTTTTMDFNMEALVSSKDVSVYHVASSSDVSVN